MPGTVSRAGQTNEHFLDAGTFARFFAKRLEPYRARLGPLIFEFGTFNKSTFPSVSDFMACLDTFLAALPGGYRYAVEIRNREYLIPDYLGLLASHNVAHVFNAWTRMPELQDQAQLSDAYTADFTVVRALLTRGRTYEMAVKAFEPYREIKEPNEGARRGMVEIARRRGCGGFRHGSSSTTGSKATHRRRSRRLQMGSDLCHLDAVDDKGWAVATTRADRQIGEGPARRRGGESPSLPGGPIRSPRITPAGNGAG